MRYLELKASSQLAILNENAGSYTRKLEILSCKTSPRRTYFTYSREFVHNDLSKIVYNAICKLWCKTNHIYHLQLRFVEVQIWGKCNTRKEKQYGFSYHLM